jgi:hypothetical protein
MGHVKFSDQEGYSSRTVQVPGLDTKFAVRELDDETLSAVRAIERKLMDAPGQKDMLPEERSALMQAADGIEGLPPAMVEIVLRAQDKLKDMPDAEVEALRQLQIERRDLIVRGGLVDWDIPLTPFAAERTQFLPPWVKAFLAQEILELTNLPERVQGFVRARPAK